jgi:3-hydroxybutyrate dehydrogenase
MHISSSQRVPVVVVSAAVVWLPSVPKRSYALRGTCGADSRATQAGRGPTMMQRMRAAIVTGAAGGIGRAVAERLTRDGVDVLAVDLTADAAAPGEPFAADLTTREGNRACVDAAIDRFGRLDIVVANAGFQHVAPIGEFPEDRWDAMLALMLTSPFLLAKYAWEHLRGSGSGRFVVIASAHGLVASPFKSAYVAAKHGAVGLVKTLALEGAADGIAATAVCPGYVRTPLVEQQIAAQAKANGIPEERVLEEIILAPHALKRLIEPSEVAELVAFLAGPAGATITGAPVTMDAGWTAH